MPKVAKTRLKELVAEHERKSNQRLSYLMISEATGIDKSTLSKLGLNQTKSISFEIIATLCDYFDCEPGDLIIIEEASDSEGG